MSIVWIWFFANLFVDVLKIYGELLGINTGFLGITILAIGNCAGDLMANIAIAKKGFGGMALTGCFAGPLFNMLVGLSLATLKLSLEFGPFDFSMFSTEGGFGLVGLIMSLGIVGAFLFGVPAARYRFTEKQAVARTIAYGVALTVFVILVFFL